jgi:hypothetical protein
VSERTLLGRVGKFNVCARRDKFSSHSGLVLIKEFVDRLGLSEILNTELSVKQRERGYSESEAVMSFVYSMIAGGESLRDLEVLRGDSGTKQLLEMEKVLAPTTAGEHLRKFDIGDIWDLQRVILLLQEKVRPHQEATTCTLDLDSSVYEQASDKKEGSTKAYNGEVGYHPLFAFWEEMGELVHSHLRRGSAYTSRGVEWFLNATLKRIPKGLKRKMRADSGFYDKKVINWCERNGFEFGITADQTERLMKLIQELDEQKWQDLEPFGVAQVAELKYQPLGWEKEYRYVVKREVRQNKKQELYFHYHVLVTNNQDMTADEVLQWQLQHANMENRIKEHKSGFSLEKLPTKKFHANWAYLLIGQIAFNLVAWFKHLALPEEYKNSTIKTLRHQLLNLAGKVVHTSRQFFLILSEEYRFQDVWKAAIQKLDALCFC